MTEELPCGCMSEVWLPKMGASSAPDAEPRLAVINPLCAVHAHLLPVQEPDQ